MGIRDRPTAPCSPWQNGRVERLIGSIRRECLDHVVIMGDDLVKSQKNDDWDAEAIAEAATRPTMRFVE